MIVNLKRKLNVDEKNMKMLTVRQYNHFYKKQRRIEYRRRNKTGLVYQSDEQNNPQTTDSEEEEDLMKKKGVSNNRNSTDFSHASFNENIRFSNKFKQSDENSLSFKCNDKVQDDTTRCVKLNSQIDFISNDSVLDNYPAKKFCPMSINSLELGQTIVVKIQETPNERNVFDQKFNTKIDSIINVCVSDNHPLDKFSPSNLNGHRLHKNNTEETLLKNHKEQNDIDKKLSVKIDCILNDSVLNNYPLKKFDPSSLITEELKHDIRYWDSIISYVNEIQKPLPEDFMKSLDFITQTPKGNTNVKKEYNGENKLTNNKKEPSSTDFYVRKGMQQNSNDISNEVSFISCKKIQEEDAETRCTLSELNESGNMQRKSGNIRSWMQQDLSEKCNKRNFVNYDEIGKNCSKTEVLCMDRVRTSANRQLSGIITHEKNTMQRNLYEKMHLLSSKMAQKEPKMSGVEPTEPFTDEQNVDDNTLEKNILPQNSHEKCKKMRLSKYERKQKSNPKAGVPSVRPVEPSTKIRETSEDTQKSSMMQYDSYETHRKSHLKSYREVGRDNIKIGVPCVKPSELVMDNQKLNSYSHKQSTLQSTSHDKSTKINSMNYKKNSKRFIRFVKATEPSINPQDTDGYIQEKSEQRDSQGNYPKMHLIAYSGVQKDTEISFVEQEARDTDKQALVDHACKRNTLPKDSNEKRGELNLLSYKGVEKSSTGDEINKEMNLLISSIKSAGTASGKTASGINLVSNTIQQVSNNKSERMHIKMNSDEIENNMKTQEVVPVMEPLEVICAVKIIGDNNEVSKETVQNDRMIGCDDFTNIITTENTWYTVLNKSSTVHEDHNIDIHVKEHSIDSNCFLKCNIPDEVPEVDLSHDYSDSDDESKLVIDESARLGEEISNCPKSGLSKIGRSGDVAAINAVEHNVELTEQTSVSDSAKNEEEMLNVKENLPQFKPNFYIERDFTTESSPVPAVNVGVIRCLNKAVTLPVRKDEKFCDLRNNILHTCYFYYLVERCSLAFKKLKKNRENITRQKIIETVLGDLQTYKGKLCNNKNHKNVKNQKSGNINISFSAKIRMKKLQQSCCARKNASKNIPIYDIHENTNKIILWMKKVKKEETILSYILGIEDRAFYKIVEEVARITSNFDTSTSVRLMVKTMISECEKFEDIKEAKPVLMKFTVYAFEKTQINAVYAKKLLRECERIMISNECTINMISKVRTVASFVAAFCRRFDDKRHINHLIYKVLYSLKYKSHAIIDAILSVWPAVFKSSADNLNILDKTIIFSIFNIEVKKNANNLRVQELSYKLTKYLQHKRPEITSENLAEELMNNIDSKRWFRSVILLSKRKDFRWAHRSIVHRYLIPILNHWIKETHDVSEGTVVKCIRALGKIMRTLPRHTAYNLDSTISVFSQILFNSNKGSRLLKETLVSEISRLTMVDYKPCIGILKKWKPVDNRISMNLVKNMNKRIFHKNCFRLWWSKVIYDDNIHDMLSELLISKQ